MMQARIYGAFTKVQAQDDGTVIVSGVASSEAVDADGEVILASAIKAALPGFLKFPAIREMHQPKAAGRALSIVVGTDGKTYVEAHVVDREAVAKVKAGVYAGFSIGGNVPPNGRDSANPKIVKRLNLTEISLVDRPANPEATFQIVKIDGGEAATVAKAGQALPDYLRAALVALVDALDRLAGETTNEAERSRASALRDAVKAMLNGEGLPTQGLAIPTPAGLAAPAPAPDAKAAVAGASVTKLSDERTDALRKWINAEGRLTKAEQRLVKAEGLVRSLTGERADLRKRLEVAETELLRRPKGALKAVPVSKADDTGMPAREAEPAADDALSAIRKAHRSPMPLRLRGE